MDTIRKLQKMLKVDLEGAGPLVKWFVEELEKTFARHQVKPTPMLLMLGEDVITHYVLVRAAHTAYADEKARKAEEPKEEKAEASAASETTEEKGVEKPLDDKPKGSGNGNAARKTTGSGRRITSKASPARNSGASLDDIVKFREKMRKSIADFLDACAAAGTPVNTGLSDLFAAIDAKMSGIMRGAAAHARETAGTENVPGAPLTGLRPDMQAIRPETETPTAPVIAIQEAALAESE